jgi:hypothetical protein
LLRNIPNLKLKVLSDPSPDLDPNSLNYLDSETLRTGCESVVTDWQGGYLISTGGIGDNHAFDAYFYAAGGNLCSRDYRAAGVDDLSLE